MASPSTTKTPEGLSITLPAPGFSGAKAEVTFALGFAGVLCFITAVFALVLQGQGDPVLRIIAPVVLGLFWLGALAMLVNAWRRSRQVAIIDVVGDAVLITTSMPFGKSSIQTEAKNIKALGVGPSGVVVNDEPVMCLRLELRKTIKVGKKNKRVLKLFRERSTEDLRTVAAELRAALAVEADSDESWAEDAASSTPPYRQ